MKKYTKGQKNYPLMLVSEGRVDLSVIDFQKRTEGSLMPNFIQYEQIPDFSHNRKRFVSLPPIR